MCTISDPYEPFSDLDLALISAQPLTTRTLALLADALEESDLPIRVDLIDWHSASPEFRARITAHHEILLRAAEASSAVQSASSR